MEWACSDAWMHMAQRAAPSYCFVPWTCVHNTRDFHRLVTGSQSLGLNARDDEPGAGASTAGALDKKIPVQTRVVWNEQRLDLEMGRGSLVFLLRFSYRAGFVTLAV